MQKIDIRKGKGGSKMQENLNNIWNSSTSKTISESNEAHILWMLINASRAERWASLHFFIYRFVQTSQSTNGQSAETLTRICFTFENTCYGFQLRGLKVVGARLKCREVKERERERKGVQPKNVCRTRESRLSRKRSIPRAPTIVARINVANGPRK